MCVVLRLFITTEGERTSTGQLASECANTCATKILCTSETHLFVAPLQSRAQPKETEVMEKFPRKEGKAKKKDVPPSSQPKRKNEEHEHEIPPTTKMSRPNKVPRASSAAFQRIHWCISFSCNLTSFPCNHNRRQATVSSRKSRGKSGGASSRKHFMRHSPTRPTVSSTPSSCEPHRQRSSRWYSRRAQSRILSRGSRTSRILLVMTSWPLYEMSSQISRLVTRTCSHRLPLLLAPQLHTMCCRPRVSLENRSLQREGDEVR